MISHGKDLKIFSGNSNRALAEAICREMGTQLGDSEVGAFSVCPWATWSAATSPTGSVSSPSMKPFAVPMCL